MPNRPYKCPLCKSVFRTESGAKWHIAHRHQISAAIDILSIDYETKINSLQTEKEKYKQDVDKIQIEQSQTQLELYKETVEHLKEWAQHQKTRDMLEKVSIKLMAHDLAISQRLGIQFENPLKEFMSPTDKKDIHID